MIFGNKMTRSKVVSQMAEIEKLTPLQLSVLLTAAVGGTHMTASISQEIAAISGLKNNEGTPITSQQFIAGECF